MNGRIKPPRLRPGERVAVASLSWGGPGAVPQRYEAGVRQLREALGVEVVDLPHTRSDPEWLYRNPQARAADLMQAFLDPTIRAIFSSIGGDDSIRILPYLDLKIIREHPKIVMGFSDTTITHLACYRAGLNTFYGPSILAGFAENGGPFPYMLDWVRHTLFVAEPPGEIEPNMQGWTVERLEWADPANQERRRKLNHSPGWQFLQGKGTWRGHLLGGNIEVLDWLRGTDWWPEPRAWEGAILFLETSEDAPSPDMVRSMLRSLAALGVLRRIQGLLFGRPGGGVPPEQFEEYDRVIQQVVGDEEGRADLAVVTQMDFGHTDPTFVLPYGVQAEIDCEAKKFSIIEGAVM